MTQCLVKGVAGGLEEVAHSHVIDTHAQCKRIDKHAHRVGYLEIAAATAHGAQIHITIVGIT